MSQTEKPDPYALPPDAIQEPPTTLGRALRKIGPAGSRMHSQQPPPGAVPFPGRARQPSRRRARAITRCASLHSAYCSSRSSGAQVASVTSPAAAGSPPCQRAAKSRIV